MIQSARIIDSHTIRFECLLTGRIEQVWAYLTDPEKLASWLAPSEIELRPGGNVRLYFDVGEAPVRSQVGALIGGHVTRHEPPWALSYSWVDTSTMLTLAKSLIEDAMVDFELQSDEEKTLLTLTHRRLPPECTAKYAAGWHAHLCTLAARLLEERPEPLLLLFQTLLPRYEQGFAGSLQDSFH